MRALPAILFALTACAQTQPRARDLGVPFEGAAGPLNAIVDVPGVEVGHKTLISGDSVRTGVTAVWPRGKKSSDPVFGGFFSQNGNGDMTGTHWLEESGFLDGPVLITNTHSVGVVRDAFLGWLVRNHRTPGTNTFAGGFYTYPVVAETYDGTLNDINGFHVKPDDVAAALESASAGPVPEGNVGGGTGMVCYGFKGGIGTSSRKLPDAQGGYTVGALVQCNCGSRRQLRIGGLPVGQELTADPPRAAAAAPYREDVGSIIIVVATDAPLLPHQVKRLARRATMGLARTGSSSGNGSGDIFIAFSTANPNAAAAKAAVNVAMLPNDGLNPVFEATVQAVEEAIVNAMVGARTMTGFRGNTVYALPHDQLRDTLKKYNRLVGKIAVAMQRSGHADLPLHGGRVPAWLAERMTTLGVAIVESVLYHHGPSEFLSRLSDPFWFQALGSVMGMDWHSSGITTSVLGALKRGLNPRAHELGIYICGGRGRHSRNTPDELRAVAERRGLDGEALVRTSRLTARIDNNAIDDGFQIYLHTFIVTAGGEWAVVQQGMNERSGMARRYHWHSPAVRDFTSEPHTGIVGEHQGAILNLVDRDARPAQSALLEIARTTPDSTLAEVRKLVMPAHHDVRAEDIDLKRLGAVLAVAYERQFQDFASLLLLENLGPRTLQSLALIAEVVHGAPARFSDPARFSFALGGKDRHPFPVPLKTYDESISVLRRALDAAKLGGPEKLKGFARLDRFVRNIERRYAPEADFARVVAHEHAISPSLDGRSVFDDRKPTRSPRSAQLPLFPS